jgi:uncharacterized protein
VNAQSYPEDQDLYVNDYAELLNDQQESDLRSQLRELRTEEDIEFTVLTVNAMNDYGHNGAIESFATGLFNAWGIGDIDRNDGLLLLVSKNDRELRIEVGSGYGNTLNTPMKRIIDDVIVPAFRRDAYADGIAAGVSAVIAHVTDNVEPQPFFEKIAQAAKEFIDFIIVGVVFVSVAALKFGSKLYRRLRRNVPRKCPVDGSTMRRYLEETEDEQLSSGQIAEEHLASVDHDVWYCDKCDHIEIESYNAFFSKFGACRECGYKAVTGNSHVIRQATYTSSGLRETDYNCRHCHANYTITSKIPRKTRSSSSGSRGGGSSSGGGASGSW